MVHKTLQINSSKVTQELILKLSGGSSDSTDKRIEKIMNDQDRLFAWLEVQSCIRMKILSKFIFI